MPKLTETLLEGLSEKPFSGMSTYAPENGNGFKFKGENLMASIVDFARRLNGAKLLNKRKIKIEAPKAAKAGQSISVTVKAERLPYVNEGHGPRKRVFIALVNGQDSSLQL